ncbi:Coiled-coil domain-containing protein 22-like [Exaiptasia diaphana]|nr:Coiled-coil domain-containing protein 22-like [Exaiptasia diaphana]
MEEVDNIIIHTLRQIGCDIPEDVMSIKDFTTPLIIQGASKCFSVINEEIQIPSTLPASMSAKFRIGTTLATAMQELGYQGEIGYQTFLYSNEADIRRNAKKDDACRKAYKYLASLHENCKELIQSVEDTGVIMREIRDLEEQIDNETQKNTAMNLERITADYKQMKEENTVLAKKFKAQKS